MADDSDSKDSREVSKDYDFVRDPSATPPPAAPFDPFANMDTTALKEAIILVKLAFPISLSVLTELLPTIIGIIYVANISGDSVLLGSVGMSRTYYLIMGFALYGVLTALPTLLPQAMRAGRMDLVRLYMQRAFYLILILSIPCVLLLHYGAHILTKNTSLRNAPKFYAALETECHYLIYALYAYIMLGLLQKVPQTMDYTVNFQLLISCVISGLSSYPLCYLFLTYYGKLYEGFALNLVGCYSINILLILCIYYKHDLFFVFKPVNPLQVFNWVGIKHYLTLALPGLLVMVFESILFEFTVIWCSLVGGLASRLDTEIAVTAAVVIQTIMLIFQCMAMGLQYALSNRIGRYVANNMVEKAKQVIRCGTVLSIVLSLLIFTFLIAARTHIAGWFVDDDAIDDLVSELLYVVMTSQFFYALVYVGYGIFRGIGEPKYAAIILLSTYYAFALPLMFLFFYVFNYNDMLYYGTFTVFISSGVGNLYAYGIMMLVLVYKVEWEVIVSETQRRLSAQHILNSPEEDQQLQQEAMEPLV